MREIKFRGLYEDYMGSMWCYGNLIQEKSGAATLLSVLENGSSEGFTVNPETVG